jgi:multimeric flavodoxin WrbA
VNGNTAALADIDLTELERRGARCEKIMLGSFLVLPCEGHGDCARRAACARADDNPAILDKVYAADGLILASPVYYEDVSALMKIFIDRNYSKYEHGSQLAPKALGLIAVAAETGLAETIAARERFVALSSAAPIPAFTLAALVERPGDAVANEELVAEVKHLAEQMAAELSWPMPTDERPGGSPGAR